MLTFDEKLAVIEDFPELTRKDVSMNRVNFHFEDSLYEKTTVVYHLHPNGNGFVYTGSLQAYEANQKGLVNIRDYTRDELMEIVRASIDLLATEEVAAPPVEELWKDAEGHSLQLIEEDDRWNIYAGDNLEDSFGGYDEAALYLREEGFRRR
ncbi:hypothetical protein [Rossellomorea sp. YZS02]|uniref:hypothetical protein n=1 Tax=Rossellomorea sp. YZS02 TaxID=3097358 RepID=UPI002A13DC9F|nr:hypothetical protein [Rossellomorea sp. YZS02]MDX8344241.1 hypothetical protein [Rossellomorea sp. YZS02]